MDELTEKVKAIAVERLMLTAPADEILPTDNLPAVYGVDSVRLFDLVASLEEDFDISFEDQELKLSRFSTIAAITKCIREKLEKK